MNEVRPAKFRVLKALPGVCVEAFCVVFLWDNTVCSKAFCNLSDAQSFVAQISRPDTGLMLTEQKEFVTALLDEERLR
jgi:hypothetical protein